MPPVDQAFDVLSKLTSEEIDREVGDTEERLRVHRLLHRRAIVRERDEQRRAGNPPTSEEGAASQPPPAEALAARS